MSIELLPKNDSEKKFYTTPGLTEHGTLFEITANGGGTKFDLTSASET